jgi:hypothetical protein
MYKVGASLIPTVFALAFWASAATASTPPCPVAAINSALSGGSESGCGKRFVSGWRADRVASDRK